MTGMQQHEERDIAVRPIVVGGVGLVMLVVLVSAAMWFLLEAYRTRAARESPPASPLAETYGRRLPPEPRLQTDPLADLARLRAAEDDQLHGYAWVDRQAGRVRIPIERAMEILAARHPTGTGGSP
jgi:hypothetical protein